MVSSKQEELRIAAQEIERLAFEKPGKAIEVDPEVAEYMGAVDWSDFDDEI